MRVLCSNSNIMNDKMGLESQMKIVQLCMKELYVPLVLMMQFIISERTKFLI